MTIHNEGTTKMSTTMNELIGPDTSALGQRIAAYFDRLYAPLTREERALAEAALCLDIFVTFPANGREVDPDADHSFVFANCDYVVLAPENGTWVERFATIKGAMSAITDWAEERGE